MCLGRAAPLPQWSVAEKILVARGTPVTMASSCSQYRFLGSLTCFRAAVGIITIASRWTAALQWCPMPGGGGCWPFSSSALLTMYFMVWTV